MLPMRSGAAIMLLALGLIAVSCGDGGGSGEDAGVTLVHAFGITSSGKHCPEGTTRAYRDGSLLVCNSCTTDADCATDHRCRFLCGPGCESDTAGCCGVEECILVVGQ